MFADIDVSMRHSEFKKSFFYSSAADYILNNLSYGRILSEDESLLKCTEKNLLPLRKGACHREFGHIPGEGRTRGVRRVLGQRRLPGGRGHNRAPAVAQGRRQSPGSIHGRHRDIHIGAAEIVK